MAYFTGAIATCTIPAQDLAVLKGPERIPTNARLALLYDVALALVMQEWNWHKWELVMRINTQGTFTYLRIEDWTKFAASANLDANERAGRVPPQGSEDMPLFRPTPPEPCDTPVREYSL